MMRARFEDRRASGLIVVLAVLAMLSIMAVTFVTLSRIENRITTNYVDDQRCELFALGMRNYIQGLVRDDSDRTWGRYANRSMPVGGPGNIPGIEGWSWGTGPSRAFWYTAPAMSNWGSWGNLYDAYSWWGMIGGCSFIDIFATPGRYQNTFHDNVTGQTRTIEVDAFIDRLYNFYANPDPAVNPWGVRMVAGYPAPSQMNSGVPIDDDADGNPTPFDSGNRYSGNNPCYWEVNAGSLWYYDQSPTVLYNRTQPMFPGLPFTGETALPGGLCWRWSLNLGYGHEMYLDLNSVGNVDGGDSGYLSNIGGLGLVALQAYDETSLAGGSQHLGRVEWKGFSGDYNYANMTGTRTGFPRNYSAVAFQPSQMSLERLLTRPGGPHNFGIDRNKAALIVKHRWGNDGKPADGSSRYRAGWRRDGATYYKLPSSEKPQGEDRYFGTNEALERNRATYNGDASYLATVFTPIEEAQLRCMVTCGSTDTILRGKIWPNEGPPYTSHAGDWRNISILKRVNVNLLGASGPESLPGEDSGLKTTWVGKRNHERERLYYMLLHAMEFTGTPSPQQKACQFIASLADMVDRDNVETCYVAPDGSGAWALGVEKFPVINEVEFNSATEANSANYSLTRLRIELYNPAENLPWIRDADEAYNISDYVLQVGSHYYRIGDLDRYTARNLFTSAGKVTTIGASGIYGVVVSYWSTGSPLNAKEQTWDRYVVVGWPGDFPVGVSRSELEGGSGQGGVTFALWKPVAVPAAIGDTPYLRTGLGSFAGRYVMVDSTGVIKIIQPYDGTGAKPGPGWYPGGSRTSYTGCYRRWEPLNGKVYVYQNIAANYGTHDTCNVYYAPGWGLPIGSPQTLFGTLGRPNIGFQAGAYTSTSAFAAYQYQCDRLFEKNFKVADGDLPSIGWLGELLLYNAADNGPIAQSQTTAQRPATSTDLYPRDPAPLSILDTLKFDLFKPFGNVRNLHMLDIFTVWDPSNDGVDNDGDGAVDDADTGRQAGDKGGPEVRVFGRIDLNYAPYNVLLCALPDNPSLNLDYFFTKIPNGINSFNPDSGKDGGIVQCRTTQRGGAVWGDNRSGHGPYETIGDLLRMDTIIDRPGAGIGILGTAVDNNWPNAPYDDDGDGVYNERDERDMIFTWVSNFFTTRQNLFEMNLTVDFCKTPYYPGRVLPAKAWKTESVYARRQMIGVIDRSTMLRVQPNGACDFSGPADMKLRFTDGERVW